MAAELTRHRFTADVYEAMVAAGVLTKDDRVELLDGEIVEMSPIGLPHTASVNRLNAFFGEQLGRRALVAVQNPFRLSDLSMPEPDVALLRPRADYYAEARPRPDDVLLLVEVADSSVDTDRRYKLPLYAAQGVTEVWLVDIPSDAVEVHRAPVARSYADVQVLCRAATVAPLAFPDDTFAVADILP